MEYIVDYKADPKNDGNNPTYKEIAQALELSEPTVYNAVMRLVGHGLLRFNANRKLIVGGRWYPPGYEDEDFPR